MPRLLTYNVHRCVGTDGVLDVGRVAAVIAALSPDIVALQEVDVGRARTGGVDQAHALAGRLAMTSQFNAALCVEEELYGDAILTTYPHNLIKAGPLPGYSRIPRLEPRGALWVSMRIGEGRLQVINTHLGLVPREQQIQARALAGDAWLGAAEGADPLMLVGDFNAGRRTLVYRTLTAHLADARRMAPRAQSTATFPSIFPVLAIDHVFAGSGLTITAVATPSDRLSRVASDHLPLIVDFEIATDVT